MASSLIVILSLLVSQAVASYFCSFQSGFTTDFTWCTYGCCYPELLDPCCDEPYYASTPFIAGITCGSITLILAAIAVLVYRRRRYNTTVQYGTAITPHVFSTTMSSSSNAGFSNVGFSSTAQVNY